MPKYRLLFEFEAADDVQARAAAMKLERAVPRRKTTELRESADDGTERLIVREQHETRPRIWVDF